MQESLTQRRPVAAVFFSLVRFMGLLLLAQGMRAAIYRLGWQLFPPGQYDRSSDAISVAAFLLVGVVLYLFLRPDSAGLGLDWQGMKRSGKGCVIVGGALLLGLVLSSVLLDPSLLMANFHAALVVPIFEELLFRGWGWGKLEKAVPPTRFSGLAVYILVTALFAAWHLGYADVIIPRAFPYQPAAPSLKTILFFKVLVGGAVGALSGFARWCTGRVYWSVLLHGLWNIFGR